MRCPWCDAINLDNALFCGQCHRGFDESVRSRPVLVRPDPPSHAADPHEVARARALERIMPGLGHLRTGQPAVGIARAGITGLWLATALILWFGGLAGRLSSLPLLAGVAVVWITGPADVRAGCSGRQPWLDSNRFVQLVVGATAAVIAVGGLVILS